MFSYFFQYSLKFFIFSSKKKEIMEMLSGVLTTEFLIRGFMLNIYSIAYLKYILDNLILKVVFSKNRFF